MEWRPAIVDEVEQIVAQDLAECNDIQLETFRKYQVKPYVSLIHRFERIEQVVVVARMEDEVIYWEDVEEGFGVSPIASDGTILRQCCNQDPLRLALNLWIAKGSSLG